MEAGEQGDQHGRPGRGVPGGDAAGEQEGAHPHDVCDSRRSVGANVSRHPHGEIQRQSFTTAVN